MNENPYLLSFRYVVYLTCLFAISIAATTIINGPTQDATWWTMNSITSGGILFWCTWITLGLRRGKRSNGAIAFLSVLTALITIGIAMHYALYTEERRAVTIRPILNLLRMTCFISILLGWPIVIRDKVIAARK